ncbi:MAG: hypothetical protein ACE5OZ_23305 [Candidatus Heimdallarchaeota archaeon]
MDEVFFKYHGIAPDKETESKYLGAEIKPWGVFSTLLLRFACEEELDIFFSSDFKPTLKDVVVSQPYTEKLLGQAFRFGDPFLAFIGSWMLSTIVRYRPYDWKDILWGEEDDIINDIRRFRREYIPAAFEKILKGYHEGRI